MAWIESHQSLGRHPKLVRLAARVKVCAAQAIGHLHFLWWWALDYAQDGDLSRFDAQEIAIASDWAKAPELWLNALKETGWIDDTGHLHDWQDYAGKLVTGRTQAKERMRTFREKQKSVRERSPNVRVTDTERSEQPQRARSELPYSTIPDHTSETHPPAGAGVCVRAGKWPTLEECLSTASMRGIPRDCAEKWWSEHDSRGGRDKSGQPVERWESCLQGYFVGWRANGKGPMASGRMIGTETPSDATF